jgi:putative membrane protein
MNYYLLFKSLHLISVISWMAGLLYLPRLFVYHAETVNNIDKNETFELMEKRLFFIS